MCLENKIIDYAFSCVDFNQRKKSHHVSIISRRNKIICFGVNKDKKTHSLAGKYGYFDGKIHSELDCLIRFPRSCNIKNCTIWNVRFTKDKELACAKPCKRCRKLIDAFGVGKTKFIDWKGDFRNDNGSYHSVSSATKG